VLRSERGHAAFAGDAVFLDEVCHMHIVVSW
jgi:hypothetical protein